MKRERESWGGGGDISRERGEGGTEREMGGGTERESGGRLEKAVQADVFDQCT